MKENNSKKEYKKKNMRFITFFLCFLIIGFFGAQTTYSWFINSRRKANRFVTGQIGHEILENFNTKGGSQDILPNEVVNKDVFIHNTSRSDALLRVKISPVWVETSGETKDASGEIELIFPNDLANNWTKGSDGYYYYNYLLEKHLNNLSHLAEGSITTNINDSAKCYSKQLLHAVKFKSTITDQTKFANKTFDVLIESDVIQVSLEGAKQEWNISRDKTILDLITNLTQNYSK